MSDGLSTSPFSIDVDAIHALNVVGAIQIALAGTDDDQALRAVVAELVRDVPIDPQATAPVELMVAAIKAARDV